MAGEATRKLAVIMLGDMAGYTRLIGNDERGTIDRLRKLHAELINPTIAEHRGQLLDTRGDGFLVIFDSPVEAVRCAIVIQQSMVGRNLELPEALRIRFRIGVNLGDVIIHGDDVQGEGVNIAARLEGIAEPGSIFISGGIYEQIRTKLVCGYQSLGDRQVKNITDPVSVYRVLPDPAAVAQVGGANRYRRLAVVLGSIFAVILSAGGGYYLSQRGNDRSAATPRASVPASNVQQAVVTPPPAPEPPPAAATPAPPQPAPPVQQAAVVPVRPPPPSEAPAIAEPVMVRIAGGTFQMGSLEDSAERPKHKVTVAAFLFGKYPITIKQWRDCVRANGCHYTPQGEDEAPVGNVSWDDTQDYVSWLSQATQHRYRLPTEAEWEFAARGGTETRYWWGDTIKPGFAVCKGCGGATHPLKVGMRPPNPYGVFDIGGGVAEWVEDCWFRDYSGSPADGSARHLPDCRERVLRGGSWTNDPSYVRSASRDFYDAAVRYPTHGFRVARSP